MNAGSAKIAVAPAAVLAVLLACLVAMAQTSGANAEQPTAGASVVGGQEAPPGLYPWMAYVADLHADGTAVLCSGTVLTPRVILTAAHCVYTPRKDSLSDIAGFRVVTGAVNWTEPQAQISEVTRIVPYPRWAADKARGGFGDAALLVLATPTTAPAIRIATRSDSRFLRLGTRARVAGWGQTYYEQAGFTESLMWAKTVVQGTRCEGRWGRVCAVDFPRAASSVCHGDSGGPLFVSDRKGGWIEIGIAEAVLYKCTVQRPQLFTRTDLLAPWINGRIKKIEAQP